MSRKSAHELKLQSLRLPVDVIRRMDKLVADGYAFNRTEYMRNAIISSLKEDERTNRLDGNA